MGSDWSKAVVLLHEAYNGKQTKPNSLQVGSKPEHMPVPLDEHSLEFQDTGPPDSPVVVPRPSDLPCSCKTSYRDHREVSPRAATSSGFTTRTKILEGFCGRLVTDVAPIFTVHGLLYSKLNLIFLNF